jgi:formate hydrogenlyase transcriptional activator
VTHSCAVTGIEPFPVGVFADEHLPWYVEAIRRGNKLFLKRVPDDFPPEAVKEREVCLAQGIKSTVAIPLSVSGSVLGIISFSFLGGTVSGPRRSSLACK